MRALTALFICLPLLLLASCGKDEVAAGPPEVTITVIGQEEPLPTPGDVLFEPPPPIKPVPPAKAHLDEVGHLKPDGDATLLGFPVPKGLGFVKQSDVMIVMAMGTSMARVKQFYEARKFSVLTEKTGLRIEHNPITKEKLVVKSYATASLIVRPWKNRLTKFIFLVPAEAGPVEGVAGKWGKAKGPQKVIVLPKPSPSLYGTDVQKKGTIPKGAKSVNDEIEAWKKAHPGEEFVD